MDHHIHLLGLQIQHLLEGIKQLQVRRRRHVRFPLQLRVHPQGAPFDGLMDHFEGVQNAIHRHPGQLRLDRIWAFAGHLLLGHVVERLGGPLHKPIDSAAVHEGWKHEQPPRERIPQRRERQHDVQVFLHPLHVAVEDVRFRWRQPCLGGERLARAHNLVHLLLRVQVWHVPAVQNIAHRLHELFFHDLRVAEEERGGLVQLSALLQNDPQVLLELVPPVSLPHFDLKSREVERERSKPCKRLPPAAAHAEEKGVAGGHP
mmetsp:Transcript_19754/g.49642  ORF Transcript_19754/g.49642 Transcript_19754/m.49642 type:complete len:260 (+) Transcript_19754:1708-2487(+)